MEQVPGSETHTSFQARLFKNLQLGRSRKGAGSEHHHKAGLERRSAGTPCPSPPAARRRDQENYMEEVVPGMIRWSGLKRRKQALDRVFSSSQPNLCCSGVESLPSSAPCSSPGSIANTPEPGSTLRRLRDHLLPYSRTQGPGKEKDGDVPQAVTPGRGHQLSHQKSSSLPGTACIENLLQGSSTADSDRHRLFQTQSLRITDLHRKSHFWRGVVSITLIEGQDLKAMDANGLSDPYVKFRLGHQKYKSKTLPKTLNPQWREQFNMQLFEEHGGIIDITVWDKDAGKRDDFIGRCQIDLSAFSKEQTHKLKLNLEDGEGCLVLLVTLTASAAISVSDLSVSCSEDQKERKEILRRYSLMRSFSNFNDVGFLQVKVIRAEGLMAADVTGKSDPFCVVELNNDRLMTHTVYKNLNPEWKKVFTFNINDIHSLLEVTVYDEDRDQSADFLGKVAIPLLSIQNGEQKAYVLKNKQLTGPTKGVIYLEIDVIFNAVKASLATLIPKEQKYVEEEQRLSKQLLLRNFIRMKRCVMVLINAAYYINSCFDWDSPQRSLAAFLIFLLVVWNFEMYMIPLALLLLLAWNYFLIISGKDNRTQDMVMEDMLEDEEEEDDKDDKDSEKKGFMNKLYAIQEVCVSVQNVLDEVASIGERIKNTFNWTVPFLTWLAIIALCLLTAVLYFIPLRYIVLLWGINKFTKKIRSPYTIDNNEILDFLSRVPSDVQVVQYREIKPDPSHSPSKRKKNNLG
ncbi:multiple C2 and transmembrane domain-containing protein 1 isoform X7 [Hyla sarda]|uniref:multiple C2 and transmembrane domain-containing protein 1 isoform X7 n=1 Tax=Hyla sarda TaxID=327740 RepID=UPI0024C2B9E0|nr:multiple C2 and transmembrane domain-containing protein 1 isoform X7 [Hyla sarda]